MWYNASTNEFIQIESKMKDPLGNCPRNHVRNLGFNNDRL